MHQTSTSSVIQTLTGLSEVVDNLLLLLSDKEKQVVVKRFNLNNTRRHTLEEIGQEFSVTRERIRQIEKNALVKMRRNVFNTALKDLHAHVGALVADGGGLMKEETLFSKLAELLGANVDENRVRLSLAIHEGLACVGNTINFSPYVRSKIVTDYSLKYTSGQLVNQMHKYGDAKSLERVFKDLISGLKDVDMDVLRLRSLIDIDKRLTLVDDGRVALLEWRHIHPRTLRDKILFVLRKSNEPMHFGDIATEIEKADFDKRAVNLQAVHNELIRHDQFVLIGRGIYALDEWGYEKGTVAEVIEKLLSEKEEMDQDEIISAVLDKRQVKRITIVLALKNGAKFERVGRKRYRLKS